MTTLREILREYADTGNLDAEYVPIAEYEALKIQAGNMSQDKERDIISRDERVFELQTEIEMLRNAIALSAINSHNLKELLWKWAEIESSLAVFHPKFPDLWARTERLIELIAATKAVLGE